MDGLVDGRRNARTLHGEVARRLSDHLRDDRLRRRADERRLSGEHLVGHNAECVDVGAVIDVALAHGLFGRHVLRRAQGDSRLCHALSTRLLDGERDAEVGDECVAVLEKNVLRLDVPMNDSTRVRVRQRVRDFARDAHRVGDRQLTLALEAGAQRFAFDERHHVVELCGRAAAVEQRQDVRMLKARGESDLFEESLRTQHRRELRVQYLHRDFAPVADVFGQVDGRHAARAELTLEAVTVGESRGERRRRRGHGNESAANGRQWPAAFENAAPSRALIISSS